MKHRPLFPLVLRALVVLIAALPSLAADTGAESIVTRVPFAFTAGDRALPTGSYAIGLEASGSSPAIRITSADGKTSVPLPVVTRLARRHMADAPKASLVFDRIGDKYFLSEVWLPGQDGFLVGSTSKKHEHVMVDVTD